MKPAGIGSNKIKHIPASSGSGYKTALLDQLWATHLGFAPIKSSELNNIDETNVIQFLGV